MIEKTEEFNTQVVLDYDGRTSKLDVLRKLRGSTFVREEEE